MLKNAALYFKHIAVMSRSNRLRMWLTGLGIFAAVIIYAVGIILSDSYYNDMFAEIDGTDKSIYVVNTDGADEKLIEDLESISAGRLTDYASRNPISILWETIANMQFVGVEANIHCVSAMNNVRPIKLANGKEAAVTIELMSGRLINELDVRQKARVAVISDAAAKILFPGDDPIGKEILLNAGTAGNVYLEGGENTGYSKKVYYEVVGVVANGYTENRDYDMFKTRLDVSEENLIFQTDIYVPVGGVEDVGNSVAGYIIFDDNDEATLSLIKENVHRTLGQHAANVHGDTTYGYTELRTEIEEAVSSTKRMINVIAFLVCMLSAISVLCVVLFSVKERIPEIGIRKAFGAGSVDIVFQIMTEVIIIAFISGIIATGVAFIGCSMAVTLIEKTGKAMFDIHIDNAKLLLPVCTGICEAIAAAIIPCAYAARVSVVKALKFE